MLFHALGLLLRADSRQRCIERLSTATVRCAVD